MHTKADQQQRPPDHGTSTSTSTALHPPVVIIGCDDNAERGTHSKPHTRTAGHTAHRLQLVRAEKSLRGEKSGGGGGTTSRTRSPNRKVCT